MKISIKIKKLPTKRIKINNQFFPKIKPIMNKP